MIADLVRDLLWARARVLVEAGYCTRPAWRFIRACEPEVPIPASLLAKTSGHYEEPQAIANPREYLADGELHVEGDCCTRLDVCVRCGGARHMQPVYGGIMYFCEGCPEDADRWEPRGTYDTDSMIDGLGVAGSFH